MLTLLLAACANPDANQVQGSSDVDPSWFISKSAGDGFAPECKAIDAGDTVQWDNQDPQVPANVTSVEEPPELYSPNLQGPYVSWTHSFDEPGIYEYYDTNTGDPGRRIVDAYYGTVTYVGASDTAHKGIICAAGDDLSCCCSDLDCALGETCSVSLVCE